MYTSKQFLAIGDADSKQVFQTDAKSMYQQEEKHCQLNCFLFWWRMIGKQRKCLRTEKKVEKQLTEECAQYLQELIEEAGRVDAGRCLVRRGISTG